MSGDQSRLVKEAQNLAGELPPEMIESLSDVISKFRPGSWTMTQDKVGKSISQPHYRALAGKFIDTWRTCSPDASPEAVALALRTAAVAEERHRRAQQVELVWTGPDEEAIPVRHTKQALLQLLNSAQERITLVSYAVYKIPLVRDTLIKAADRGVSIRVIIENPEPQEGQNTYDTLIALGRSVADRSQVYLWPTDKRGKADSGKFGSLHVKCAVADGKWLFVSSANLTEYAFTVNMELGVLISGGRLPRHVEKHFDRLIESGVLRKP